jgi:long-chain acyl-CoA synthetase
MADGAQDGDVIAVEAAGTLDGLFRERVRRTPDLPAYRFYNDATKSWRDHTWAGMNEHVLRWAAALQREGLSAGERVAVCLRNSPEWVMFDIAAMTVGLVVVPLYTQDRPDNIAYVLNDAGCKLLLLENGEQWNTLAQVRDQLAGVQRFLTVKKLAGTPPDPRIASIADWVGADRPAITPHATDSNALATIVYTSGTTGRPKGVMLSHRNILTNAHACLTGVMTTSHDDLFLSFLPLSHTFERTCGYYLPMMAGSTTAYARSVPQLGEDLQTMKPTVLVSVPRIYERVWGAIRSKLEDGPAFRKKLFLLAVDVGYAKFKRAQGRGRWKPSFLLWPLLNKLVAAKVLARLGGRMKAALSGGAALPPEISRIFIGLGLPVVQGYGMTECAPVACANRPRDNVPESVGTAVPGVEVRVGEQGELLIRGPNVMLGYWNNDEATRQILSSDGWLNSGDLARIDGQGHVYITGRLKEIIVMSTGEKVPPVDVETAIVRDKLFEQVILLGEAKPFLSLIAVLNADEWTKIAAERGFAADASDLRKPEVQQFVLQRIRAQLKDMPGYADVRRAAVTLEPWTIENGLLTPTMKLKRSKVMEKFDAEIDRMYAGH